MLGIADALVSLQELFGSAKPMIEGDELDVTLPSFATPAEAINTEGDSMSVEDGITMVQKVAFFGIIIAAVAVGMKIKGGRGDAGRDKSLA